MIKHIKQNEFENEITNKKVLVDFFATWCGPCKMLGLTLEKFDDIPWTPNACISVVEYDKGKFTPKVFAITEHLEGLNTNLPNF